MTTAKDTNSTEPINFNIEIA